MKIGDWNVSELFEIIVFRVVNNRVLSMNTNFRLLILPPSSGWQFLAQRLRRSDQKSNVTRVVKVGVMTLMLPISLRGTPVQQT